MNKKNSTHRRQLGQSTIEFVVLSLVMVPLLLIVPLLGKYMDIAQTTAVASRYMAFEGAVRHSSSNEGWKSDAALGQEVRRRFFSNSDAFIKTNDTAGDFTAHRNTLWFDHRGKPLLSEFGKSVGVATDKEEMSRPSGAAFASKLGLSDVNLYTGRVTATVADVSGLKPFDALGLTITRTTTLLADPWAASGPGGVKAALTRNPNDLFGPFPYGPLEAEVAFLKIIMAPIPFESLPDVGIVTPDQVPTDRLAP